MLLPIGVPRSVNLGGAERLDFWRTVVRVAKAFDLAWNPIRRPWPDTTFAQTISRWRGWEFPHSRWIRASCSKGHDEAWGRAQDEDYVAHHYHQPSDEYRADWDFRGNAKLAQFGFVLGWLASAQPKPVEWLAGDEFEGARKASRGR